MGKLVGIGLALLAVVAVTAGGMIAIFADLSSGSAPAGEAARVAIPTTHAQPVQHPNPAAPQPVVAYSNTPIVCTTPRVIDGVTVEAGTGTAVLAGNGCVLRISNCVLSGRLGIQAAGSSIVHVTNCRISGQQWGVSANATARLHLAGGSVQGGVGSATVADTAVISLRGTRLEGQTLLFGGGRIEEAR